MIDEEVENIDFDFDQQDPKPTLPESRRRKLDSIIVDMDKQGASREEIMSVVDDYKKRFSTKPLVAQPKPKQSQPVAGMEMAGVFGGEKLAVKPATVVSSIEMPKATRQTIQRSKALGKAKEAQDKVYNELKSNDDVVEKFIRQSRFNTAGAAQGAPTSEAQATDMQTLPQQPEREVITPEEIELVKKDVESDETIARGMLNEIKQAKPEKKRDIESSVYRIDAVRRTQPDSDKFEKINQNAKEIEKGNLIYDVQNGRLIRPQGALGSMITGWQHKTKGFDDYAFLNNKSDQEIIEEYEKRRASYDPDEPIAIPKHKLAELSQSVGGMPLKPMIAGVMTTMAGAPEAAPFVAGGVGAADFYQLGYAGTFERTYNQLRDEGKTPEESLQMAQAQAKKEAAVDAAVGGSMSIIGARIGARPLNFSEGYRKAAFDFLKAGSKEGGIQAAIGGAGEYSKNLLAQAAGIKRNSDENVLNAIEGNFLLTIGMGAAANLGRGISQIKYRSILNGLSRLKPEVIEANITSELNAGRITEQQANNIRSEVKSYQELDAQIPGNVTEEARLEIQKKIEKRNELEGKMESLNKAFHPEIKEKIAKLDEEINELAKSKEPRKKADENEKEVSLLIDDAIRDGVMNDIYAGVAKENPEGFMKFVADQSFGRTDDGTIHEAGGAEGQMREQFGDAIVDKAKELYPLAEKKSSVSVIMPEEQKPVEAVTVGAKESEVPPIDTPPPPEEPIKPGIHVERPGVELSHGGLQDVANEFSLPDVQTRERKSDVQLRTDAGIQIQEWANKGELGSNIERLTQEAERGEVLTDKERVIMEQHLANVMEEARNIADKSSPEYAAKFAEISRLKKAGEKTRSEAGAALRIPGTRSTPTSTPEDMIIAKEEAVGRPTTPEEKQKTNSQFEKIDKAKKSLAAKGKEIADKIRSLRPKTDQASAQFFGLPIAVYDTAIVAIAEAVEQGAKLADAIQQGIAHIKSNGGFKNRKDEKLFAAYIKGQLTYDERLQQFKERTVKTTEKLKQKTADKDFEPDVKSILELDEEARKIKKEYRDAKYEFELELQKDRLKEAPLMRKAARMATMIGGLPRTLMTIVDFSGVLRQGATATISHPILASKAMGEMFKQTFSKAKFDEWLADVKESPLYDIMDKSGLYISDPNSLHLSAHEEGFMSANLAEKIPIWGEVVKASERAYVSFLNKMRVDLFKQGVEVFMNEGKTIHNSPDLYEGFANFINNTTGRGKLGPLEGSADFLNTIFFSPRLMASRMNMLGLTDIFTLGQKGFYSQLPGEVRKMAMKDMLKFIGFGISVLGLSKMAGAEVEDDPRSTDFGKIKIGNTRYDIWAGFQPYVRLIAQVAYGQTKSTSTGALKDLNPKQRFDRVTSFLRGKLAPVPGSIVDIAAGENIIGEPVTVQSKLLESIKPMIVNDVADAMKDQGIKAIFTVGVPSLFGVGSTTYGRPNENKSGSDRSRQNRQGPKNERKRN